MKNRPQRTHNELRPEYDFDYSKAIRGKYYQRLLKQGANVVVLEPDIAKAFRDSAAVNDVLRSLLERGGIMSSELRKIERLFKNLCKQQVRGFPRLHKELNASKEQGVYLIVNCNDRIVHVGRTRGAKQGIYQRLKNHLYGSSSFTRGYLASDGSELRKGYKYRYLEVKEPRERALLESYAIAHLCPLHIGTGEEQSSSRSGAPRS